jgi:hypothetical protein
MTLNELIDQLKLTKRDHPHAADLPVRCSDLDVFAVNLDHDGDHEFVNIETYRPWALQP